MRNLFNEFHSEIKNEFVSTTRTGVNFNHPPLPVTHIAVKVKQALTLEALTFFSHMIHYGQTRTHTRLKSCRLSRWRTVQPCQFAELWQSTQPIQVACHRAMNAPVRLRKFAISEPLPSLFAPAARALKPSAGPVRPERAYTLPATISAFISIFWPFICSFIDQSESRSSTGKDSVPPNAGDGLVRGGGYFLDIVIDFVDLIQ